jgi:hypothetical protein
MHLPHGSTNRVLGLDRRCGLGRDVEAMQAMFPHLNVKVA